MVMEYLVMAIKSRESMKIKRNFLFSAMGKLFSINAEADMLTKLIALSN